MTNLTGSILVVDDNEMNRDLLSRRLERRGYAVSSAADGRQAMEMIGEQNFDLVLLDIMMPGISGLEVLKTLRTMQSITDLPIIKVTARDQSADIVKALGLGANDYVTKPIDFAVVLARVNTQLNLKRLSELKDQFLRIASHDLKNPLQAILGSAYFLDTLIEPGATISEQIFNIISSIGRNAKVMQRIIEDFLDFQAMRDGQLNLSRKSMNLNDILKDSVEINEKYSQKKEIKLFCELLEDLPQVKADPDRIQQVVNNLLSNAIKFSSPKKSVTIKTSAEKDWVRLEVSDSGPGLTSEDLKKIFGQYARLSNKPTGSEKSSGLGLSICKQLIDLHEGEIGVRNNDHEGATFWFRLPIN